MFIFVQQAKHDVKNMSNTPGTNEITKTKKYTLYTSNHKEIDYLLIYNILFVVTPTMTLKLFRGKM